MNRLFYISLIISVLGIFLLLIISNLTTSQKISSYSNLSLNKYVQTSGKIINIQSYDDFSVIKLDNNITITCNCKFRVNETIQIQGKVTEYQNKLQIEADKIEKI